MSESNLKNSIDFNEKYKRWLENGFDGLEIDYPEVIEYLDRRFQEFIKRDEFKYSQIELMFGSARFYANGLERFELDDVEFHIDKLLRGKLNPKYP